MNYPNISVSTNKGGMVCINGVTLSEIFECLSSDLDWETVLKKYPQLSRENLQEVFKYAATTFFATPPWNQKSLTL